jgi:N-acetylglucosamine-6-sulfatase
MISFNFKPILHLCFITILGMSLSTFNAIGQTINKPNVIVIYIDELRADALGITGHPFVKTPHIDQLAKEGIIMRKAYVTTPLCGPSRASLMTGQYAHTHGLYKNTAPKGLTQRLITYPLLMQYGGYKTAFIGKWTTGKFADKMPHPGFDRWFVSGHNRDLKMDPVVNVDGVLVPYKGHATDIDSDETVRFIKENKSVPFSISLWHRSVHTSYGKEHLIAAERNRNLYKDVKITRAKSAINPCIECPIVRQPALKNVHMEPPTDEDIRNIARMTVDIDDGVGRIVKALKDAKILDKTMIIFMGDNGFFFGEHGLTEKRLAYEESIKVPLIIRYPPLIKAGSTSDVGVLNIDIAPTVLSLAGLPIPLHTQGQSLIPIFKSGKLKSPRSSLLFEFWPENNSGGTGEGQGISAWKAVRTDKWKYVHWSKVKNADELYDVVNDPYELNNLINDPRYASFLAEMKKELEKQMIETKDPGELLQLLLPSSD